MRRNDTLDFSKTKKIAEQKYAERKINKWIDIALEIAQDIETQFHTIDFFIRDILSDMQNVSMSTKKTDMVAYISAWKNTLETIKYMIDI
jgi:hypothetical protein